MSQYPDELGSWWTEFPRQRPRRLADALLALRSVRWPRRRTGSRGACLEAGAQAQAW